MPYAPRDQIDVEFHSRRLFVRRFRHEYFDLGGTRLHDSAVAFLKVRNQGGKKTRLVATPPPFANPARPGGEYVWVSSARLRLVGVPGSPSRFERSFAQAREAIAEKRRSKRGEATGPYIRRRRKTTRTAAAVARGRKVVEAHRSRHARLIPWLRAARGSQEQKLGLRDAERGEIDAVTEGREDPAAEAR